MFKTMVKQLIAAGWTQSRIAREIGISQPSVSDLATGGTRSPRFYVARKLIDLHQRIITDGAKK